MLRHMMILMAVVVALVVQSARTEDLAWKFTPDGWKSEEWILVKSPRWAYFGQWVQKPDHIENEVPADAKPVEWQGKRAPETYTSMVNSKRFTGDIRVTATTWFTPEMAPIIVLAPELGKDSAGRAEYREHFEICAYNKGVNIWHHLYKDGKPSWKQAAYARFELKPETPYLLDVEIKGKRMIVRIDGHEFGYLDESLPAQYHVGVTGCEGLNHFYNMSIKGTPAAPVPSK